MLNHRRTLFMVAAVMAVVMLVGMWPQHQFTGDQMTDRHKKALELIGSADSLRQQSRVPESLEAAREAIRLMESARDAGNLEDARQLQLAYTVIGVTLAQNHRDEESVEWFEKALAAYEEEHPHGGNHQALAQLASLRHNDAAALSQLDPTQAAVQLDMAVALKEKLLAEHPEEAVYRVNLVRTYLSLSHDEDRDRAMRSLNRSLVLLQELIEANPEEREYHWLMGQCAHDLGDALQPESLDQAIDMYSMSMTTLQNASQMKGGLQYVMLFFWIDAQTKLAECMMRQGKYEEARTLLVSTIAITENAIREYPDLYLPILDPTAAKMHLGRCHTLSGNHNAGKSIAEELATVAPYSAARIRALRVRYAAGSPHSRPSDSTLERVLFRGLFQRTVAN